MTYTVTLQCSIDVEANSENGAYQKAFTEVTFGTDFYNVELVEVVKDE